MKNSSNIVIAFVAGATLGALAGVLFAPRKGSKTRELLREEGQKMVDSFLDKFDDAIEKFSSLREDVADALDETEETITRESV